MELHIFAALSLLLAASGAMGSGDWPLALGRVAFEAEDDAYSPSQARAKKSQKLNL